MSKSIEQLRALAAQIEEAYRQGENTQVRVGGLFMDIIDFMSTIPAMQTVLGPLLQALNNSDLINPSDGQTLTFSLMKDGWTFSDSLTQLQIKLGQISSTVTSNYNAFLQTKDLLQREIDSTDERVRGYKTEYDQSQIEYATWKSQTDTSIAQYAVAIDKNTGDIISISGRVDTAYDQLDFVTNNLEASDKALNNLLDLTGLQYEDPEGSYTSSWLYKNRQGIYGAAATFDDQGNIIQDSVLSVTVNGISSKAENALGQVTLVTQTVGLLQAEVTRNKEISDAGFTQLSKLINDGDESLEHALQDEINARTAEGQTTATRLNVVEGGMQVINARFDEDGHPIGWSELTSTVDRIDGKVYNIDGRVSGFEADLDHVSQTLTLIDGRTANMGLYVTKDEFGEELAKAEIKADDISFDFTRRWDVTANGGSPVMSLDTSGNLYIKGELLSGSTIGNMYIDGYGIHGSDGGMRTDLNVGGLTVYNPYGNAMYITGQVKINGFSGSSGSSRTAIEIEGFSGTDCMISIPNLPTSKPSGSGYLYKDSGTLKIS